MNTVTLPKGVGKYQKGDKIQISNTGTSYVIPEDGLYVISSSNDLIPQLELPDVKQPPDVEYANERGKIRNNYIEKEVARQIQIKKRRDKKKFSKKWNK